MVMAFEKVERKIAIADALHYATVNSFCKSALVVEK